MYNMYDELVLVHVPRALVYNVLYSKVAHVMRAKPGYAVATWSLAAVSRVEKCKLQFAVSRVDKCKLQFDYDDETHQFQRRSFLPHDSPNYGDHDFPLSSGDHPKPTSLASER